jgi:hypothetical protein
MSSTEGKSRSLRTQQRAEDVPLAPHPSATHGGVGNTGRRVLEALGNAVWLFDGVPRFGVVGESLSDAVKG